MTLIKNPNTPTTTPAAAQTHTHTIASIIHSVGQAVNHVFTQPSQHAAQSHSGGAVDAHSAHDSPSHLPPYFVVYIWKRTA